MSANQWSQFVKKDSGFAFLAYWNDMLVGLVLNIYVMLTKLTSEGYWNDMLVRHICDADKIDLRGILE